MAVENISGMKKILNTYNAEDWVKSAPTEFTQSKELNQFTSELNAAQGVQNPQSFSEMLTKSMVDVNKYQEEADVSIKRLITGQSKDIHSTMLAVEKAEIAFKTMNQIRSKVIEAYREIMRMQI